MKIKKIQSERGKGKETEREAKGERQREREAKEERHRETKARTRTMISHGSKKVKRITKSLYLFSCIWRMME